MALLDWAEESARALLAESDPRRWAHVQSVAGRAGRLTEALFEKDSVLLSAAAWLHDIGYAPDLVAVGFHPLDGARFLRGLDVPPRLPDLVAFHSSAASEAAILGLDDQMAEFNDERTLVRDLLWYADMTVGPGGECMTFERRMEEIQLRYAPDHYVVRALDGGMGERQAAVDRAERWIKRVGLAGQV